MQQAYSDEALMGDGHLSVTESCQHAKELHQAAFLHKL